MYERKQAQTLAAILVHMHGAIGLGRSCKSHSFLQFCIVSYYQRYHRNFSHSHYPSVQIPSLHLLVANHTPSITLPSLRRRHLWTLLRTTPQKPKSYKAGLPQSRKLCLRSGESFQSSTWLSSYLKLRSYCMFWLGWPAVLGEGMAFCATYTIVHAPRARKHCSLQLAALWLLWRGGESGCAVLCSYDTCMYH